MGFLVCQAYQLEVYVLLFPLMDDTWLSLLTFNAAQSDVIMLFFRRIRDEEAARFARLCLRKPSGSDLINPDTTS
jgi:hypothetical protein